MGKENYGFDNGVCILNVSSSGVRVASKTPLIVGETMTFEFGPSGDYRAGGQVRWVVGPGNSDMKLIATEFCRDAIIERDLGFVSLEERFGRVVRGFEYVAGIKFYRPLPRHLIEGVRPSN